MFCQNCGSKNSDESVFCENCGVKLESGNSILTESRTKYRPTIAKVKKPMSLKKKLLLIIAGFMVLAGFVIYMIGSNISKPENIVKGYFDSMMTHDWNKAYSYLDIIDGQFSSKSAYEKFMTEKFNDTENVDISNYSIEPATANVFTKDDDSDLVKAYIVRYTKKGSASTESLEINLIKQSKKTWLFFNNYKIAVDNLVSKEYSVYSPKTSRVYIDDIEIAMTSNEASNNNYNNELATYKAVNIFTGKHKLKITTAYSKDLESQINVANGDSYTASQFELTDQTIDDLAKKSEDLVKLIYNSAIEGKTFDMIKSNFLIDENALENFKSTYDNIAEDVKQKDGTGLKSITFSEFKANKNNIKVSSDVTYSSSVNFKYTYIKLQKDYFNNNSITEYTPDSLKAGDLSVTYIFNDGKWLISSLSRINIYY